LILTLILGLNVSIHAANPDPVYGENGMVVSTSRQASEAGIEILKKGGNAVDAAVAVVDPSVMGYGPVPSTEKLLKRFDLTLEDIGLIELNEAFAAQTIGVMRKLNINPDITNVNGGALALGHPLGCSGARILTTLIHEMKKRDTKYGLATLCISVGQGISTIVEGL
tara:strand:- start:745 stop:1245 length:501 start_codon:yes stop_codon:yes gene_type:complete